MLTSWKHLQPLLPLNSVFYSLFPAWGSIKFILSYSRLSCRCTSGPRGVLAKCVVSSQTWMFEFWIASSPPPLIETATCCETKGIKTEEIFCQHSQIGFLKSSGNTEKALKMSRSGVRAPTCRVKFSRQHLWLKIRGGWGGGRDCWSADVDNSWWGIVHNRVFLLRTASAHVFVGQRVWRACSKDEDTPALVQHCAKHVAALPCRGVGGGGGGLLC